MWLLNIGAEIDQDELYIDRHLKCRSREAENMLCMSRT